MVFILLIGFILIFFTIAIGLGSIFLGANNIINKTGKNISNVLPENIFPDKLDELIPNLINVIGDYSPIFLVIVVCSIATFNRLVIFFSSSSAILTRDILKKFFLEDMTE